MHFTTLPLYFGLSLLLSSGIGVVSHAMAQDKTKSAEPSPVSQIPPASGEKAGEEAPKGLEPIKIENQPAEIKNDESSAPTESAKAEEPKPETEDKPKKNEEKNASTDPGQAKATAPKKGKDAKKAPQAVADKTIDTLEKALIAAYLQNPQIKEQQATLRAADERVAQAKSGWRPSITANASVGFDKKVFSGDSVNQPRSSSFGTEQSRTYSREVGVTLNQNIFNGGATVYATQKAEAEVKAARAALADTEQQILLAAAQAYLDLWAKEAEIDFLHTNENVLKKMLEAALDKFKVGEETKTTVAQAEGQHAEAMARLLTAEAELEGIRATFEKVTGRAPGKLRYPEDRRMVPQQLQAVLEKARTQNPAILRAQFEENSARKEIDRVNSGLLPKLDLQGSSTAGRTRTTSTLTTDSAAVKRFEHTNDRTVNHRVTLNLSVPIYEQGLTRGQKREALEIAEQRRIAIETARRAIDEVAIASWESNQKSKANITHLTTLVKATQTSVDGTQQEVEVGSKILLDLLDEQRKLVDAQLKKIQEEKKYYFTGFQVLQAMGMLTAQSLKLNVKLYDPDIHYEATHSRW
jgi:outer membrane protein